MAHTETFYVSVKDNKVRPITNNIPSYWRPIYDGKNYGKAKYCVEVFSTNNHKEIAEQIRNVIDEKGLSDKLFTIKVETK